MASLNKTLILLAQPSTKRLHCARIKTRDGHRALCRAAAPGSANFEPVSSASDIESLHAKLRGTILLYEQLVPIYGKDSMALYVWRMIRQLPPKDRLKLLQLPARALRMLWRLSNGLYRSSDTDKIITMGGWNLGDDFPESSKSCHFKRCTASKWGFGFVQRSSCTFENHDGNLAGTLHRRQWFSPWCLEDVHIDVTYTPELEVPGTTEPALLEFQYNRSQDYDRVSGSEQLTSSEEQAKKASRHEFFRCAGPGVYTGCCIDTTKYTEERILSYSLLVRDV